MALKDLSNSAINALADTRDADSGVLYFGVGEREYHYLVHNALVHLSYAIGLNLRVAEDDANDTTVRILPGRVLLDGVALAYAGAAVDLVTYNNDVAYVWIYDDAGTATIGHGTDAAGWPATTHIKLAEVTLASGAITQILDRRAEAMISAGIDVSAAMKFATFSPSVYSQGTTATPSTIRIQLQDANGNDIAATAFLRVRICNSAGYTNATNATIAAAGSTTVAETLTATKDLVLKSSSAGLFELTLTDGTAETVTLRMGMPTLSGLRGDYSTTQDVTHAAP